MVRLCAESSDGTHPLVHDWPVVDLHGPALRRGHHRLLHPVQGRLRAAMYRSDAYRARAYTGPTLPDGQMLKRSTWPAHTSSECIATQGNLRESKLASIPGECTRLWRPQQRRHESLLLQRSIRHVLVQASTY